MVKLVNLAGREGFEPPALNRSAIPRLPILHDLPNLLCQKSNFFQAVPHVNSFSSNSLPAIPSLSRSSVDANSRETASANAGPLAASSRFSPSRAPSPSAPKGVDTTGSHRG